MNGAWSLYRKKKPSWLKKNCIIIENIMPILLESFNQTFLLIMWRRWQTPPQIWASQVPGNISRAQPMMPIMGIRTNYWVQFIGSHNWAWVSSSQACELDYRIHLAITSLQLCWPALGWAPESPALWPKGRLFQLERRENDIEKYKRIPWNNKTK